MSKYLDLLEMESKKSITLSYEVDWASIILVDYIMQAVRYQGMFCISGKFDERAWKAH